MNAKRLKRLSAILGAVTSLVVTVILWRSIASGQEIWLLPGLYLVEMAAVSILSTMLSFYDNRSCLLLSWACVGVMAGFVVLGAWSIGPAYAPAMVFLAVAAILALKGQKKNILASLAAAAQGAIVQVVSMLILIKIF